MSKPAGGKASGHAAPSCSPPVTAVPSTCQGGAGGRAVRVSLAEIESISTAAQRGYEFQEEFELKKTAGQRPCSPRSQQPGPGAPSRGDPLRIFGDVGPSPVFTS